MKKLILILLLSAVVAATAGAGGTAFAAGLGFDFFNYRAGDNYLSTSVTLLQMLGDEIELNLGSEFGLTTEPQFFIPINAGLNFRFPVRDRFGFMLGLGLTPVFLREKSAGDSFRTRFYMGPYLKGGFQIQTHRYMSVFVELQQDLLIGAPDWINTATRIHGGIIFSLPDKDTASPE